MKLLIFIAVILILFFWSVAALLYRKRKYKIYTKNKNGVILHNIEYGNIFKPESAIFYLNEKEDIVDTLMVIDSHKFKTKIFIESVTISAQWGASFTVILVESNLIKNHNYFFHKNKIHSYEYKFRLLKNRKSNIVNISEISSSGIEENLKNTIVTLFNKYKCVEIDIIDTQVVILFSSFVFNNVINVDVIDNIIHEFDMFLSNKK